MFQIHLYRRSKQTFYVQQISLENRALYEIMWKNNVDPDRLHKIILHMRFACSITKPTVTLSILNTYCFSTAKIVSRTKLNVMLQVHSLFCIWYFRLSARELWNLADSILALITGKKMYSNFTSGYCSEGRGNKIKEKWLQYGWQQLSVYCCS